MEETFYKRVSVKEELPEKCNNATFSEWVPVYSYETLIGEGMYDFENQCWQIESNIALKTDITHWLKPFPILSRDKMIESLVGKKIWDLYITKEMAEPLAEILDAILKSGLPEKKDIEEMIAKLPVGEYTIRPAIDGLNGNCWGVITEEKAFYAPTLTEAITNYYNEIIK